MSVPVPAFAIHLPSLSRLVLLPPQSLRESFIDILPFNNGDSVQPSILVSLNKQCSVFVAAIYSRKNRRYTQQGHLLHLDILQYSNLICTRHLSQHQMSHTLLSKHSPQETPFHLYYQLASSLSSKTRKQLLPSGIGQTFTQPKTATPNISQAYITDSISSSPQSVSRLFTDHHEGVYVPRRR